MEGFNNYPNLEVITENIRKCNAARHKIEANMQQINRIKTLIVNQGKSREMSNFNALKQEIIQQFSSYKTYVNQLSELKQQQQQEALKDYERRILNYHIQIQSSCATFLLSEFFQILGDTTKGLKKNNLFLARTAQIPEEDLQRMALTNDFSALFTSAGAIEGDKLQELQSRTQQLEQLNEDIENLAALASIIAQMVDTNDELLIEIEDDIEVVKENVVEAKSEVKQARAYQKSRYKLIGIVVGIVLVILVGVAIYLGIKFGSSSSSGSGGTN